MAHTARTRSPRCRRRSPPRKRSAARRPAARHVAHQAAVMLLLARRAHRQARRPGWRRLEAHQLVRLAEQLAALGWPTSACVAPTDAAMLRRLAGVRAVLGEVDVLHGDAEPAMIFAAGPERPGGSTAHRRARARRRRRRPRRRARRASPPPGASRGSSSSCRPSGRRSAAAASVSCASRRATACCLAAAFWKMARASTWTPRAWRANPSEAERRERAAGRERRGAARARADDASVVRGARGRVADMDYRVSGVRRNTRSAAGRGWGVGRRRGQQALRRWAERRLGGGLRPARDPGTLSPPRVARS